MTEPAETAERAEIDYTPRPRNPVVKLGSAQVIRANSRALPLPDNSVDLVVTSPPYFALRSYQDGGEHYAGQIGDEPTPAEFVVSLIEVTRECVRVLKPSGSLWVNLGDKYASYEGGRTKSQSGLINASLDLPKLARGVGLTGGGAVKAKSLFGVPWRYALACIDDLGLILRSEVIWSKPNGLPESVTDRVRRSHETWFHFTLEPRYFSAVDTIREAHTSGKHGQDRHARTDRRADEAERFVSGTTRGMPPQPGDEGAFNPLGKLPGSVWTVATEPLKVPAYLGIDHFAAFPTEWPKRLIQGWSPMGVCTACGEGRRPVTEVLGAAGKDRTGPSPRHLPGYRDVQRSDWQEGVQRVIVGETCACPESVAPTRPAVVLDPFGGTGTTAMVAKALGRRGISVDMSADYCRLAQWRTNDRDQLAKVLGLGKVEQQPEEQDSLFDLTGGAA